MKSNLDTILLFAFNVILILLITNTNGFTLQNVTVIEPVSVENGSEIIVLDCPYELREDGLVIKWYYENEPIPSYQWIPPQLPQDTGMLKGRLDIFYNATEDESSMYRALAIVNPTTELTGEYRCLVSSFSSEASIIVYLTVYSPPSEFIVDYIESDDDSITVFCSAFQLYPQPNVQLFRSVNDFSNFELEPSEVQIEHNEVDNTYNITLNKTFSRGDLSYENNFLCELTINQTDYTSEVEISYYPDGTTTSSPLPTTVAPSIPSTPNRELNQITNVKNGDKKQSSGHRSQANGLLISASIFLLGLLKTNALITR